MKDASRADPELLAVLDQISTRWPALSDPTQFVMRYASAIQRYLSAIIKNPHDVEEVLQDFLLRGLQHGFVRGETLHGRFRDYLKAAVRNAALDHLRRRILPQVQGFDLDEIPLEDAPPAHHAWVAEWRRCVLDRAWEGLFRHQKRSPGNLSHTVLRLASEHPDEESSDLAGRAAALAGRPLAPAAFRKQLSRARHRFAELIVKEVAQTLAAPTPEQIESELVELGLFPHVRDFLPDDWHETGKMLELVEDNDSSG
jgi:RNA polymerase sigma-70 factor (ECF subfamily)